MKLKKPTKKIWYGGKWWELVQHLTPTAYDDYFLLQRPEQQSVHEDGTTPIDMEIIDTHNVVFMFDSKEARKAADAHHKAYEVYEQNRLKAIRNVWLKSFKDEK